MVQFYQTKILILVFVKTKLTEFWDGFEFKFEFSRLNSKAIATGKKGIFAARFAIWILAWTRIQGYEELDFWRSAKKK